MLPDPARWYCCLAGPERIAIDNIWFATIGGTLPLTPAAYVLLVVAAMLPYSVERGERWNLIYPHDVVIIVNPVTELPEEYWVPRLSVWQPIIDFRDDVGCAEPAHPCPLNRPPFDWST